VVGLRAEGNVLTAKMSTGLSLSCAERFAVSTKKNKRMQRENAMRSKLTLMP